MTGITTHVLDLVLGRPAVDLPVVLERQDDDGAWRPLGSATTDGNGRCANLLPAGAPFVAGIYKLVFDTGRYFRAAKADAFYPRVTVEFTVEDEKQHYHVPLLLNRFGYTTYRGS